MKIFFLDVASHNGLLACVSEQEILAATPLDHRVSDQEIMPAIEGLLDAAGQTYTNLRRRLSTIDSPQRATVDFPAQDLLTTVGKPLEQRWASLTHLACVVGPGGFTSLRVGVTCANVLADQLGIPSAGIHLADLYAARSNDPKAAWVHSTKRTDVFLRLSPAAEPIYCSVADAVMQIPSGGSFIGELLPEHRQTFLDAGFQEAPLRSVAEILPSFLSTRAYEKKILDPWYGRGW